MLSSDQIRKKYLDFFIKKLGHKEIEASPLLAENDASLLFVNSGMFPLVPFLMGQKHPAGKRLVNVQRAFRSDDIDEIGDHRHQTMFEMLGNWSLGDYFKKEQLNWWYEFLVEELGLDPNRLYQSVYAGNDIIEKDTESISILQYIYKKYGVSYGVGKSCLGKGELGTGEKVDWENERIFPYRDKNWWQRADAPGELGGPDSETFYDTGKEHDPKYGKYCHINCDCGRFIEIGNSVFIQYKRTEDTWLEIEQKNVDFGGGLERITMVLQNKDNVFATDVFSEYIAYLETKSDISYNENQKAYELIVDHLRASLFLIADGALPSNKDQGYYLRRLLRRLSIYLKKINLENDVLYVLLEIMFEKLSVYYKYLLNKKESVFEVIFNELLKFEKTLEAGLKYFNSIKIENNIISGKDLFILFTSYGFPLELVEEMAKERNLKLDKEEYFKLFKEHQELSRKGAEQKFKSGLADNQEMTIKLHTVTHLLHQALREILGDEVKQKGSNINVDRLRFDFEFSRKLTNEEKQAVEDLVNSWIKTGAKVYCEEMSVGDAVKNNAIALFKDRYDEKVSVYSIGSSVKDGRKFISREVCRGPHVKDLSELGHFRIKKEESSSAGVRRIKAILE